MRRLRSDISFSNMALNDQMFSYRPDVFIQAEGAANSAGSKLAGADVESGHPGVEKRGDPALNGPIEVSVDCQGTDVRELEQALKEAGVRQVATL
jgi:hypothetical protein